jgi:hypothetical protein
VGIIREEREAGAFRDDINMVVEGYCGQGLSYAEAIGVLFGVAVDLVKEAREAASPEPGRREATKKND